MTTPIYRDGEAFTRDLSLDGPPKAERENPRVMITCICDRQLLKFITLPAIDANDLTNRQYQALHDLSNCLEPGERCCNFLVDIDYLKSGYEDTKHNASATPEEIELTEWLKQLHDKIVATGQPAVFIRSKCPTDQKYKLS